MDAKSFISNPDRTEATIVMTMPLKAWKEVRDALKDNSTSGPWQVHRAIGELVDKMEERFYPRTEA